MTARLATALRLFGHAVDVACTAVADGLEVLTARVPDVVPAEWVSENTEWIWTEWDR